MQHEIQLMTGRKTWKGWLSVYIGILQIAGSHKEFQFLHAPERIKISSYNHRLFHGRKQGVEVCQLALPVPVFQRQMHQKNNEVVELQLNHQFLDTRFEKMKLLGFYRTIRNERISLPV